MIIHPLDSILFFSIYFYQLEANYFTLLQWFLPYIDMNQPWIYMCSPSRSPLPPPSPSHPSGSFQCTSPALVSCIQPGLVICFTLDSILVPMLFSQNIPSSPSPTESKSLFCTSVSLFLFCIQGYCSIFLNSIYMHYYTELVFIFTFNHVISIKEIKNEGLVKLQYG